MKSLLDLVLKNLAAYVPVLVALTSGPKRTVTGLLRDDNHLENALVFGCTTAALGFMLQAPLAGGGDAFNAITASMFGVKILAILAFSGAITFAFRRVGGTGDPLSTLSAYLYIVSPLYLLFTLIDLVILALLSGEPGIAASWRNDWSLSDRQIGLLLRDRASTAMAVMLFWLMALLSTPVWFAICWGAFRRIHQVSVTRSIVAFVVAAALCCAIFALSILVMRGIHGGSLPDIR